MNSEGRVSHDNDLCVVLNWLCLFNSLSWCDEGQESLCECYQSYCKTMPKRKVLTLSNIMKALFYSFFFLKVMQVGIITSEYVCMCVYVCVVLSAGPPVFSPDCGLGSGCVDCFARAALIHGRAPPDRSRVVLAGKQKTIKKTTKLHQKKLINQLYTLQWVRGQGDSIIRSHSHTMPLELQRVIIPPECLMYPEVQLHASWIRKTNKAVWRLLFTLPFHFPTPFLPHFPSFSPPAETGGSMFKLLIAIWFIWATRDLGWTQIGR